MKIILCSEIKEERLKISSEVVKNTFYSIECGLHDGAHHFDHHGEFSAQPSPCVADLPRVEDSTIQLSHIDSDSFLALARMVGVEIPSWLDLDLVQAIDNSGQGVCKDKFNKTLLFVVGVGALARKLHFPIVSTEEQDVTDIVKQMLATPFEEIVETGRAVQEVVEPTYARCVVAKDPETKTMLIHLKAKDSLSASRAYEDGYTKVVIFRDCYKSISIYADNTTPYNFEGKVLAGVKFDGHEKAAGSPRGVTHTLEQAKGVYDALRLL